MRSQWSPPADDAAEDEDLAPVLSRPRSPGDAEMDITPMIDITFLLLIFFLVVSRMDTAASTDLPDARHGDSVAVQDAIVLTMVQTDGGSADIYLGDGVRPDLRVKSSSLADQEAEIVAYVQQQAGGVKPKDDVLIKADRRVKHRAAARVAAAVGKVEAVERLHFAVREVQ